MLIKELAPCCLGLGLGVIVLQLLAPCSPTNARSCAGSWRHQCAQTCWVLGTPISNARGRSQTTVMQKLSRWSALETRRQEEEEQAALAQESQQLSMDQRTAANRQLFNPKEAFVMVRFAWGCS